MLKNFLNTNPKNFGLLITTTFITQTSHYVLQHLISEMPRTTKMADTINRISPVGQKQEAASPSPNATAYCPVWQFLFRRIKLTAVTMK